MTQYLLSVWHEGEYELPDPEVHAAVIAAVDVFNKELEAADAWVFGGGLLPPSTAVVALADGDAVSTSDGPYSESAQQMGGFWVIEAANMDDAMQWSRKAALACQAPVELRPFQSE